MGDNDRPRHFKAGSFFYLDLTFDGPLPPGAWPVATLAGPVGHSTAHYGFETNSSSPGEKPNSVRISGNLASNYPSGSYKVTKLEMRWTAGSPPNWQPQEIDFSHLGEDAAIIVDPADQPPQPPIPRITDLD